MKIFPFNMIVTFYLIGCTKLNSQASSEMNTMVPKIQGSFQRQCFGIPKKSHPFPGRDVVLVEHQVTRFHRFGPMNPGQPERLIRQEITHKNMTSTDGSSCGMAAQVRVATYESSDYEALLRYSKADSKGTAGEVAGSVTCGFVEQRLPLGDIRAQVKLLIALRPYSEEVSEWAAADYRTPYAVFTVQDVVRLAEGSWQPSLMVIRGTFDAIEVDNKKQSKRVAESLISALVTGAPVYAGDPMKSDTPNFLPIGSYGWVKTILGAEDPRASVAPKSKIDSTKKYYKIVIQEWL